MTSAVEPTRENNSMVTILLDASLAVPFRLGNHWSVRPLLSLKTAVLTGKPVSWSREHESSSCGRFVGVKAIVLVCRYSPMKHLRRYLGELVEDGNTGMPHEVVDVDCLAALDGTITRTHTLCQDYSVSVFRYLSKLLVYLAGSSERKLETVDKHYLSDRTWSHGKLLREIYRIGCRRRCRIIMDTIGVYMKPTFREKVLKRTGLAPYRELDIPYQEEQDQPNDLVSWPQLTVRKAGRGKRRSR